MYRDARLRRINRWFHASAGREPIDNNGKKKDDKSLQEKNDSNKKKELVFNDCYFGSMESAGNNGHIPYALVSLIRRDSSTLLSADFLHEASQNTEVAFRLFSCNQLSQALKELELSGRYRLTEGAGISITQSLQKGGIPHFSERSFQVITDMVKARALFKRVFIAREARYIPNI